MAEAPRGVFLVKTGSCNLVGVVTTVSLVLMVLSVGLGEVIAIGPFEDDSREVDTTSKSTVYQTPAAEVTRLVREPERLPPAPAATINETSSAIFTNNSPTPQETSTSNSSEGWFSLYSNRTTNISLPAEDTQIKQCSRMNSSTQLNDYEQQAQPSYISGRSSMIKPDTDEPTRTYKLQEKKDDFKFPAGDGTYNPATSDTPTEEKAKATSTEERPNSASKLTHLTADTGGFFKSALAKMLPRRRKREAMYNHSSIPGQRDPTNIAHQTTQPPVVSMDKKADQSREHLQLVEVPPSKERSVDPLLPPEPSSVQHSVSRTGKDKPLDEDEVWERMEMMQSGESKKTSSSKERPEPAKPKERYSISREKANNWAKPKGLRGLRRRGPRKQKGMSNNVKGEALEDGFVPEEVVEGLSQQREQDALVERKAGSKDSRQDEEHLEGRQRVYSGEASGPPSQPAKGGVKNQEARESHYGPEGDFADREDIYPRRYEGRMVAEAPTRQNVRDMNRMKAQHQHRMRQGFRRPGPRGGYRGPVREGMHGRARPQQAPFRGPPRGFAEEDVVGNNGAMYDYDSYDYDYYHGDHVPAEPYMKPGGMKHAKKISRLVIVDER